MISPQTIILKAIQAKIESAGLDWVRLTDFRLDVKSDKGDPLLHAEAYYTLNYLAK